MNKLIIILIGLLNLGFSSWSQVTIEPLFFHIDHTRKMILINKDLSLVNSTIISEENEIVLDATYTFTEPVSSIELGKSYSITSPLNESYSLFFTQLPIVTIQTEHEIINDPRVEAELKLVESNGNLLEHTIGIELRGASSRLFNPKKSYRIEFWEGDEDQTKSISLLGMRKDDDWNLQAMYNEPLKVRSKIHYELWGKLNTLHYQSIQPEAKNFVSQEYLELFLNGDYYGIYAISERIDRKQLQLEKSWEGNQLSGELYKGVAWGLGTTRLKNLPVPDYENTIWDGMEMKYPNEFIDWSNLYDFVDFVFHRDSLTFNEEIGDQFQMDNAIDYFIFLNLLKATDNTGKNLFIAKYRYGSKYFYVPWDLDGGMGTSFDGSNDFNPYAILTNNRLYERLILDTTENNFLEKVGVRWNDLRESTITYEKIMSEFQKNYLYLKTNGVYEREKNRWPQSRTDTSNLPHTSDWILKRLSHLDNTFSNPEIIRNQIKIEETSIKIFPNPITDYLYIESNIEEDLISQSTLTDSFGRTVCEDCKKMNNFIDVSSLVNGVYFLTIYTKTNDKRRMKILVSR